jgi:CRP-like cAMP-binding protein
MSDPTHVLVAKLSLHTHLDAAEKQALVGLVTRTHRWKAGEAVAAPGEALDIATIVLDGMMARTKNLPDGRRQILSLLLPGDMVDAQASVLRRRDDALEAVSGVVAAIVPQSRMAAIGAQFPRLHEAFLREAMIEASVAREWVLSLGRRTAQEALAHLLCEVCLRLDAVGLGRDGSYSFPPKQQQLADCLGLSNIHLNRVVKQLRDAGLIEIERRTLRVENRPALERLAKFNPDYLHFDSPRAA